MKQQQLKRNYNGLIDYILILSLILGIFIFIAMPFFYVFKESLVINGSLSFELFEDVFKNHLRLLKNSLSAGLYTTVLRYSGLVVLIDEAEFIVTLTAVTP